MTVGLLNGVSVPLSGDALIDAMTNCFKWQLGLNRNVDWSIPNGWLEDYWNNPSGFSNKIHNIFVEFSYFANIKFTYNGNFNDPLAAYLAGSDINFAPDSGAIFGSNTTVWAIGYFPDPSDYNRGDVTP